MTRIVIALAFVLATATLGGCKSAGYSYEASYGEHLVGELDAQWFVREVREGRKLTAIELVYCPLEPNTELVCRTAVVWEHKKRPLFEPPESPRRR